MKISVIIPARNEEDALAACIESVLQQDYEDYEMIVVNDGSTDQTAEIAARYPLTLVNFDHGHSAAFARNAGAKKAKGDVLYFLDADVSLPNERFLSRLAEDYELGEAVGHRIDTPAPRNFIQRCQVVGRKRFVHPDERLVQDLSRHPEDHAGIPGLRSIKTGVFKELGGFDESIFYFEDGDLDARFVKLGGRFVYDPELVIHHEEPADLGEIIRQARWIGRGLYTLSKRGEYRWKTLVFWWTYILCGLGGVIVMPLLAVFALLNLAVIAWWAKIALRSRDPLHAAGWMVLHFFRNLVISAEFIRLKILEAKK